MIKASDTSDVTVIKVLKCSLQRPDMRDMKETQQIISSLILFYFRYVDKLSSTTLCYCIIALSSFINLHT